MLFWAGLSANSGKPQLLVTRARRLLPYADESLSQYEVTIAVRDGDLFVDAAFRVWRALGALVVQQMTIAFAYGKRLLLFGFDNVVSSDDASGLREWPGNGLR